MFLQLLKSTRCTWHRGQMWFTTCVTEAAYTCARAHTESGAYMNATKSWAGFRRKQVYFKTRGLNWHSGGSDDIPQWPHISLMYDQDRFKFNLCMIIPIAIAWCHKVTNNQLRKKSSTHLASKLLCFINC